MTTQPNYFRYLESAKQADTARRLRDEGFHVEEDKKIGDVVFDLIATRDDRTVAYEFKAQRPSSSRQQLVELQQVAKEVGFEFRIIGVVPPAKVHVEIDNLQSSLLDYVINENFPQELDSLSTHTTVNSIDDIDISDIHIGQGQIRIDGAGQIAVRLQYGSNSDDGFISSDSIPFSFQATLSADGSLQSVEEFTVDTAGFYE